MKRDLSARMIALKIFSKWDGNVIFFSITIKISSAVRSFMVSIQFMVSIRSWLPGTYEQRKKEIRKGRLT